MWWQARKRRNCCCVSGWHHRDNEIDDEMRCGVIVRWVRAARFDRRPPISLSSSSSKCRGRPCGNLPLRLLSLVVDRSSWFVVACRSGLVAAASVMMSEWWKNGRYVGTVVGVSGGRQRCVVDSLCPRTCRNDEAKSTRENVSVLLRLDLLSIDPRAGA